MLIFKLLKIIIVIFAILFSSCSKIRESAGVTRKNLDEFQTIENLPLVIPPDFNLVPPDQLKQKNIDDIDKELAKEILFGLGENKESEDQQLSTMNQILLKAKAIDISNDIRTEIDEEFSNEKKTKNIFDINWENEEEVLDAIKESERIRNKNFRGESISSGEIPIKKEKAKKKKKKRFFFF